MHICTHLDWFADLSLKGGKIASLGDVTVDSKVIGTILFIDVSVLFDVLYAAARANLISISAGTKLDGSSILLLMLFC